MDLSRIEHIYYTDIGSVIIRELDTYVPRSIRKCTISLKFNLVTRSIAIYEI